MRMTGEERIAAPRNRVWEALNDPEVLRQSIPGCQSLQKEADNKLRAVVEIKIGPIGARFNSVVTLTDIQAPNGYTLIGEGQGGTVGQAKATIKVRLTDEGANTLLSYDVDAQVGGRLAQLGGPIIDATAKQFAGKFFKRFSEVIGGGAAAPAQAAAASTASAVATGESRAAATAPVAHSYAPAPASSSSFPIAWILALVVAALAGYLVGHAHSDATNADWMGLAIGLLVVIVAAAGFEFGRRAAAPQIVLDAALLDRLLRGDKR